MQPQQTKLTIGIVVFVVTALTVACCLVSLEFVGPDAILRIWVRSIIIKMLNSRNEELAGRFNIDLRFDSSVTDEVARIFIDAKNRWESIITNEHDTEVFMQKSDQICGRVIEETEEIDDLIIWVSIGVLDGEGGVLANAGPVSVLHRT